MNEGRSLTFSIPPWTASACECHVSLTTSPRRLGKRYRFRLIHREWSGVSVKQHKAIKGLKTQNLRDHMSEAELILTALAELSTRQIAETVQATGVPENAEAGRKGGAIAGRARRELEAKTGRKMVTGETKVDYVRPDRTVADSYTLRRP